MQIVPCIFYLIYGKIKEKKFFGDVSMHKIGENILYGSNGVMTVVDIREETVGDLPRSYYVLRAATGRTESLVFVPTDNEKLTSAMHSLLTKDEISKLLSRDSEFKEIEWVENNRARTEYFKRIMESGDRAGMVAMMRAIHESGIRRIESGKKNYLSDESVRQKAEKLLSTELSVVLGISDEEALSLIKEKVES